MWKPHFLIRELSTINGHATSAVLVCNVSALHHEFFDHSMEDIVLKGKLSAFLTSAQASEVFNCFGHFRLEQLHHDPALLVVQVAFLTNLYVEEDLRVS